MEDLIHRTNSLYNHESFETIETQLQDKYPGWYIYRVDIKSPKNRYILYADPEKISEQEFCQKCEKIECTP